MYSRKVAVVTGGSRGLGCSIIREFVKMGIDVITVARNVDRVEMNYFNNNTTICTDGVTYIHSKIGDKIDMDWKVAIVKGDISDNETVEKIKECIERNYGYINILINNAGIERVGGLVDLDIKDWNYTMNVNINAVFNINKAMLKYLYEADGGSIINISSIKSKMNSKSLAYSVSKSALDMMTKHNASELSRYNIRVNSVSPGLIDTGFQVSNKLMSDAEYTKLLREGNLVYPLGIGRAMDVVGAIKFLISDEARWITGTDIVVDGGMLASL